MKANTKNLTNQIRSIDDAVVFDTEENLDSNYEKFSRSKKQRETEEFELNKKYKKKEKLRDNKKYSFDENE